MVLGKLVMHGSVKTPTFVRLATEPRAGNTTLSAVGSRLGMEGWRPARPAGHAPHERERNDRRRLDQRRQPVGRAHGAGDLRRWQDPHASTPACSTITSAPATLNGALDFLPHVGNLTRNVIVRSESATGTRGHMMGIHRADLDIRYALFKDLGRTTYLPLNTTTNHIGRYPIHMHHLAGPVATPANGYQFTVVGNAVDGGSVETKFKWGITVHGTHYGSVKDNVVYNYNGASIATEDGSESFNVFDHNFALRGIGEPSNSVSEARMAMGTEGVGFWFRGPNNYVKNNVAANFQNPTVEAAYGYAFLFRYLGNIAVPKFKGAMNAADFTTVSGHAIPIRQFEGNEAYGAMQGGFTQWWVGGQDPNPTAGVAESVIKNLAVWHVYNKAVYMYPSHRVVFDGLVIRGKFDSTSRCCGDGVFFADYSSTGIIIRNSDIQGMEDGIKSPSSGFTGGSFAPVNLTIENTLLRNHLNLLVYPNGSVNGCWMGDKLVVASNVQFQAPPGRSLSAISMSSDSPDSPDCPAKRSEMRVYAYNGVSTDNFQAYTTSSSVIPRPSCGSPATRAGINGLTCTIAAQGPVPPTATFTVSPTSMSSGQSATLTWNTTNATTVSINQGIGTVAASGTRSVSPTATTTYTLTATNSAGSTDRDRHPHRRRHAHHADDHLEHSRQHHLRNRVERHAVERDHDGTGVMGVFAGERDGARGGDRTGAVGHVQPDRRRGLQLGERVGRDHRAEGDATHHVGEPGRHQLRDAAERHAVELDGERRRDLDLRAGERHDARRRRRAAAFYGLHADLDRQLQHGEQDRGDHGHRDADDRAQRGARQCLR